MTIQDTDIEALVLRESILSAYGLNSDNLQIGIRGDPSMRETTGERKRYESSVDRQIRALAPNFEELLLNRSIYRLFVGFNNGEIRTNSIFDPLTQEIHSAEKLADHAYIERQFPVIDYDDKVTLVRELYQALRGLEGYQKLPDYWRRIMDKRSRDWEPMEPAEIRQIMTTMRSLREMPVYFMRNITICMVQSIVRIQFNCDGTQLVRAENFQRFLEENLPS